LSVERSERPKLNIQLPTPKCRAPRIERRQIDPPKLRHPQNHCSPPDRSIVSAARLHVLEAMKLPVDTIIAPEKVTHYLLVAQARGDKSGFLERAGYTSENAAQLLTDLRVQLLPLDATPTKVNDFGQYYETCGRLTGPNGSTLAVRAIWMTEFLSGATKFVTLLPEKRKT
jgi:hypothetical protein